MLWFWIFMLIMALLIPLTMIGFGAYFKKTAPEKINRPFGYRTTRSMKNMDTWVFAHQQFGQIWFRIGLILLPISVIAMLFCYGGSEDFVGFFGAGVTLVQCVLLLLPIFFVESALKKNFDEEGYRKA